MAMAFIILLIHTGWNAASLRALICSRVTKAEGGYFIQGFKGKTGRDTPEVFIDRSHRGAVEAIELLVWNHERLKSRGCIREDDLSLWHMWPFGGVMRPMGNLDDAIRRLNVRYGVQRFSLDQIRTHMLVRLAVKRGTAEASRVAAGHKSLSITTGYLDQFVVRLMSKSINLEFQRRFEKVVLNLAEDHSASQSNILKGVGDGTSCIDPKVPPNKDWLIDGECGARNCHTGNGCPNNRILLTEKRLEEIVRFHLYHKQRWRLLFARNPDEFMKAVGPAILLNSALLSFLQTGLLKDLVKPAIDAITSEIG
jgi:hypothetical protein